MQCAGRWTLALLGFCIALLMLVGCDSPDRVDSNTRTAGLSLTMEVRRDEDSIAVYRVFSDGTLEFAGGKSALFGGTDWTGLLTDEEIVDLRRLIAEHQWLGPRFDSTDEPENLRYAINFRSSDGHRRASIAGENPRVKPVRELLERAAARRNEPVLDSLPRPSIEKLSE